MVIGPKNLVFVNDLLKFQVILSTSYSEKNINWKHEFVLCLTITYELNINHMRYARTIRKLLKNPNLVEIHDNNFIFVLIQKFS